MDEDGGFGKDTMVIRVVDVLNRNFENGFRIRPEGSVANEWEPYVISNYLNRLIKAGTVSIFSAEEFVVHNGQRSQRISGTGEFRAGIYQQVGTNINWDYQVSAWYHKYGNEKCRLGIDPVGGIDPNSSDIIWMEGSEHLNWAQLAERVTAKNHALTIFLEVLSDQNTSIAYFDDVTLMAYPCIIKEKEPLVLPEKEEKCVNWNKEKENREVMGFQKNGFIFKSERSLQIVVWGIPANQGKLLIPDSGLLVILPFEANNVIAHIVLYTNEPIIMKAINGAGKVIGQTSSTTGQDKIQTLEIKCTNISRILLTGGGNESLLVDLCAYRQSGVEDEEFELKNKWTASLPVDTK